MRLVCRRHDVTLTVEGNKRTVFLPPISPSLAGVKTVTCGLLMARDPRPGELPIIDSNGRDTGLTCMVEEI